MSGCWMIVVGVGLQRRLARGLREWSLRLPATDCTDSSGKQHLACMLDRSRVQLMRIILSTHTFTYYDYANVCN